MNYAVIRINRKQYKVTQGEEILVNKLSENKMGSEVLLYVDDDKVTIGTPNVKNIKVTTKVLGEEKGEKVKTLKYKAKSRYRRRMGFRPQYTRLLIEKIG